jgi:hypothetical protein
MTQPEPFACPFKRSCWQREILRWVLIALTAWMTAALHGCAVRYSDSLRSIEFTPYAAPPGWTPLPLAAAPPTQPSP